MKTLRKYHKWPSLIIGAFLILFSVSGIIMNHRPFFSPVNVKRSLLPPVYRYNNWNLAAVKGNIRLENNSQLIYGNIGIWACDSVFSRFTDLNQGFGKGIDQRKVFTMLRTSDHQLLAGTLSGLWKFDRKQNLWVNLRLPERNPRVVKLAEYNGQVYIMTRDHIYTMASIGNPVFSLFPLSVAEGADGKTGLFNTLWVLHSGEMIGLAGKLLVDLVGFVLIFISLSGFFYTFLPKFAKRTSQGLRQKLQRANRISIKWHNLTGGYGIVILIITVVSGMFLRPPLLIPIAGTRVAPVPGTILDNKNPWHDKLRDFVIDSANNRLIISTSEGFYESVLGNDSRCRPFRVQPPVSVMGITVFEHLDRNTLLVGSFSGLYRWNPELGEITDVITGSNTISESDGNPFGATAVSGIISGSNGPQSFLDYDGGWVPLVPGLQVPEMPGEIRKSPMSLWNVALEVHTGRIFSVILGDFYILYVPMMGIITLVILITGFLLWYKQLKRKKKKIKTQNHENHQIEPGTKSTV